MEKLKYNIPKKSQVRCLYSGTYIKKEARTPRTSELLMQLAIWLALRQSASLSAVSAGRGDRTESGPFP
eukprot:5027373-Pleurochrysis_carterae.AAC.1